MSNVKVTKDLSDNIKAAAILADFYGFRSAYTDTNGSRGGQFLVDKVGNNKVVTFKGSNNIPLRIGDNWYFCDTDTDITLPNDLDDYLADVVVEDGTGTWTAGANVTFSTDSGQVKLAVAAGAGPTQNLGYIDFAAKNFSTAGKNAISFLITSSINFGYGAIQFRASESAAIATPAESLSIPGLKAGVQTRVILSFASASAARDAIISIGLYAVTDFGAADIWIDDISTTSIEAGRDYFVYACDNAGALVFKVSKASTYPAGFSAATSRKIGGIHTLALTVGTIAGHTLTTYDTADVNPYSIWDLKHRPRSNPAGMVYSPKTGKWADIYLVSGTGTSSLSVNGGTISDSRDWMSFVDDAGFVTKRLMNDSEFQCIATGINEETNILGSSDPTTTGPHIDSSGRRMISNIGCEDMCGVIWQWLLDQSYRYDSDGTMLTASKTLTITHAAAPGGNPIYVKYGSIGRPYLCCNMATPTSASRWLTFGGAVTLLVIHDADAATGGYQVYFDEDATQQGRLLAAVPGLKSDYLDTSDPNYPLKITYAAAPYTPGVAITYDDGADNRLEFISPTSANGTLDLASYGLTWSWYDLPGGKGSLYKQSSYGDVKLVAGGDWSNSSNCGSRSRGANNARWNANANIGARFVSEPL